AEQSVVAAEAADLIIARSTSQDVISFSAHDWRNLGLEEKVLRSAEPAGISGRHRDVIGRGARVRSTERTSPGCKTQPRSHCSTRRTCCRVGQRAVRIQIEECIER